MTTAAELISAAESADWSSFNSLVNAATPGDIAAIGSAWNDVMASIGNGVSNSVEVAPKSLFNSAMTSFFAASVDYLTGDSVVSALFNLAEGARNYGVDHLSTEMKIIINDVPASVVATTSIDNAGFVLDALADNQANNAEVTPAELKNMFSAYTEKFGAVLGADAILYNVANIASNDRFYNTDFSSSVKVLLSFVPGNSAVNYPQILQYIANSLSSYQSNPEVTPAELNNLYKLLAANYGPQLDVNDIMLTIGQIAQNDSFEGGNNLASIKTLIEIMPDNKSAAEPSVFIDALDGLARYQTNPDVTPAELNNAFQLLVSNYGPQLDVDLILSIVAQMAHNDGFNGTDYLASVRTLLSDVPDNKADAHSSTLLQALDSIVSNQTNPAVTADELNKTIKVMISNYGPQLDVDVILQLAAQIAQNDQLNETNNFDSVLTLLAAHPDNMAMAHPTLVLETMFSINGNAAYNPAVSEHEVANALGKIMIAYGNQAEAIDLAFVGIDDVSQGKFEAAAAIYNHMDAAQFTDAATYVDTYSDALLLTTGNDSFDGAASAKIAVYGGAGRDVIDFSANPDSDSRYLDGGAGRDTLIGGLGDDVLVGGRGSDTLTGGDGADTFRFDHLGTRIDHVTDFNAGQGDRIDLHDVLGSEAGLAISDYVHLETSGGNTIVSVDKDGTGGLNGFVQVAQLDNVTGLDVNDLYANGADHHRLSGI